MMDPDDDNGFVINHQSTGAVFTSSYAPEPRKTPFYPRVIIACVIFGVGSFIATLISGGSGSKTTKANFTQNDLLFVEVTLSLVLLVALGFGIPWFVTRRTYMKNQNDEYEERIKAERRYHVRALEKLKRANELNTLMQLNQGQIDTYHRIVTDQADKSFKSSRIAMGVGMFLLVCAAVGGAYVPVEQVRWFIGALAAFSTVLSGYLSKTYLTLYKESISQLNRYFDQPVLNSYYLTAERLTGGLAKEHQDEIRKQVISEVLNTTSQMGARSQKEQTPKSHRNRPKKQRQPKKQTSSVNGSEQAAP
ncbi:hypothetical protein ABZ468_25820 [Streptomyces sp. NPDC005708]|uniref:TRADD-N-associated membrane domain-containing protein n=1 Tax=Streptomyces sp. NPDC005708 TaxID=3154564 RepID=UPI0033C73726